MKLRGIEFRPVFCAPGARGWFGGFYRHQIGPFRPDWRGTTFAAKTTTLNRNEGNLPWRDDTDFSPQELRPRCIVAKPFSGHLLNAVSLSGPGVNALLDRGLWQSREQPFVISFMAIKQTKPERLEEWRQFVWIINDCRNILNRPNLPKAFRHAALHLKFACPNTSHELSEFYDEIGAVLEIAAELEMPLLPCLGPTVPVKVIAQTANHPLCDGLWLSNTVPWGDPRIDWQKIFGRTTSPLLDLKRGLPYPKPGGLCGPVCLPIVLDQVKAVRRAGVRKPIIAGNGIQDVRAVRRMFNAGATAIALGTVVTLRPWRMRSIIKAAYDAAETKEGV